MSRWACFGVRCGADWAGEAWGGGQSGVSADWYGKMAAHITLPGEGRSRTGSAAPFSLYSLINSKLSYFFLRSVPSWGKGGREEPRNPFLTGQGRPELVEGQGASRRQGWLRVTQQVSGFFSLHSSSHLCPSRNPMPEPRFTPCSHVLMVLLFWFFFRFV